MTIEIYGKTYTDIDASADLGDANGFFRKEREGIVFLDAAHQEKAFIRRDGLGPVSLAFAAGKRHYMGSTSSLEARWMGIPESYNATREGARALANQVYA